MNQMEAAIIFNQTTVSADLSNWVEPYRLLPLIFSGLFMVWTVLVAVWTVNNWSKRRWQTSNLHWVLTAVPILKALMLCLSFVFWYFCLNLSTCSFWVAFGVYVTGIFFETACFVVFLLISHGYCILHEQLSVSERRTIAGLSFLLYLTLSGYKAAVPFFSVLVVLVYLILIYKIFFQISKNLSLLREQLHCIQDERLQIMHTAIHATYTMFKNFQVAMLLMVVAQSLIHARANGKVNEYWMRLIVREWTEVGIFFCIGWTFRAREVVPILTVIPTMHSPEKRMLPPIYSIEMNQKDFENLDFKEWNIGVPTKVESPRQMFVIVQNPGMSRLDFSNEENSTVENAAETTATSHTQSLSKHGPIATCCFTFPIAISTSKTSSKILPSPSKLIDQCFEHGRICKGSDGCQYKEENKVELNDRSGFEIKEEPLTEEVVVMDVRGESALC